MENGASELSPMGPRYACTRRTLYISCALMALVSLGCMSRQLIFTVSVKNNLHFTIRVKELEDEILNILN